METIDKNQINLLEINPNSLPELQGWKEKQEALVRENPFVSITDNASYKEAKTRRTALITGRTTIQNQDKLIASAIKELRSKASKVSKELINITLPHEEKQQDEVRRYEAIKAREKAEKERLEQERKEKIQSRINHFYNTKKEAISELSFTQIIEFNESFEEESKTINDTEDFEEFELDFTEKVRLLKSQIEAKTKYLTEQENQREERERLELERKKLEEDKRASEEEARKEREELDRKKRDQRLANLEAKRLREEEENRLIEERKAIEAEKKRLEKIESDRINKEKEEKRAKELEEQKAKDQRERLAREEAERKRIEALKPEKEKLVEFVNSLQFSNEAPEIIDSELKSFLSRTPEIVTDFKIALVEKIDNLK